MLFFYLSSALPLLVTVLAYGYSISLPFYLDDPPHFSIIRDFAAGGPESLLFFWGGNGIFPYYRPVMFTVWKGWAWLGGRFDPVGLHLLNVFCYGLTAVLVGLIARRIVRRVAPASGESVAGLIAGVGFALYPFSYQAVTLIAALSHLGLALGATFSFYFAVQWLDGRGAICLPLCWAGAVVGVFSHENGVTLLPLLAVLIVTLYGVQALRLLRTLWVLVPVASMTGAYLLVWSSSPGRSGLTLFADLFVESLATLAQGLIYPAAALAGRFVAGDAGAASVLALAALVALGVWVWLAQTARVLALRAGYGLFWYVLGIMPSALLLLPGYVSASPRLTLFSAVGAAIFWGVCGAALWNHKSYRIGRAALAALACVSLAVSAHFLRLRYGEFARMSAYTWQLLALTREQNVPGLLLVNPPDWVAPSEEDQVFLRGAEGVTFGSYYVYYSDLFWLHTGQVYPLVDAISVDAIKRYNGGGWLSTRQPTLEGAALVELVRQSSHIYVTEFEGDWFRPVYVGGPALSGTDEPLVRFGHGEIGLTQARANFSPQRGVVTVLTRWRVDAPSAVKPGVYVFCDGRFIAQRDGAVWGETYPFSAWRPGEAHTDLREIRLSGPVTRACLQVFTAVYQEADGVRWPASDATSGEGFYDNLAPIPLTTTSDALYPFGD